MFRRTNSDRYAQHFGKVVCITKPKPVIIEATPAPAPAPAPEPITIDIEPIVIEQVADEIILSPDENKINSPTENNNEYQQLHEIYKQDTEVSEESNPIAKFQALAQLVRAKSNYDKFFKKTKIIV